MAAMRNFVVECGWEFDLPTGSMYTVDRCPRCGSDHGSFIAFGGDGRSEREKIIAGFSAHDRAACERCGGTMSVPSLDDAMGSTPCPACQT
jgi:uncharacterized paraquat-inducible protein A